MAKETKAKADVAPVKYQEGDKLMWRGEAAVKVIGSCQEKLNEDTPATRVYFVQKKGQSAGPSVNRPALECELCTLEEHKARVEEDIKGL